MLCEIQARSPPGINANGIDLRILYHIDMLVYCFLMQLHNTLICESNIMQSYYYPKKKKKHRTFSLLLEDIIDRQEEAKYFPTWKIQISNTSTLLFVSLF